MRRSRFLGLETLEPRYALDATALIAATAGSESVDFTPPNLIVNVAPGLDWTASPTLAPVLGNSAAPSGPVGTLVADLVDSGGRLDNYYDSDGDAPGIVITETYLQGGKLWFSLNGGTSWAVVEAVSDTAGKTLFADQNTRLYYQPPEGFTGSLSNIFSFQAWDRTGGYANGSSNAFVATSVDIDVAPTHVEFSVEMGSPSPLSDGSSIVTGSFTGIAAFGSEVLMSSGEADGFVIKVLRDGSISWTTTYGGPGNDYVGRTAVAVDGSSVVYGSFAQTVSFGAITLQSTHVSSKFLARLSPAGDFLWAAQIEGNASISEIDLAGSGDGSAIVAGSFSGTINCGGRILQSRGGSDAFVAKFNSLGSCEWAAQGGGVGDDGASGIARLTDGSSVVTGSFLGSATFGGVSATSSGGSDLFVAKLDAQGLFQWATTAGGADDDLSVSIAARPDGSSAVLAHFKGTATFGQTTLTVTERNDFYPWVSRDLAVATIDQQGSFIWAKKVGSSASITAGTVEAFTDGHVIISGRFHVDATFGGISLESDSWQMAGPPASFYACLSSAGEWAWARGTGGPNLYDWSSGILMPKPAPDGSIFLVEMDWKWGYPKIITSGGEGVGTLLIPPSPPEGAIPRYFIQVPRILLSDGAIAGWSFSNQSDVVGAEVLEVVAASGSGILAKDASGNVYAETTPIFIGNRHATLSTGGFALTSVDSSANTLFAERNGVTYRIIADNAWNAPDLFQSLRNSSSGVLDPDARRRIQVSIASNGYRIYGDVNPTVVVQRGKTYTLDLDVAGKPFFLQTVAGAFLQQFVFTNGFDGSGRISGAWLWRVPENAPDELFYVSRDDARFGGQIIVTDS